MDFVKRTRPYADRTYMVNFCLSNQYPEVYVQPGLSGCGSDAVNHYTTADDNGKYYYCTDMQTICHHIEDNVPFNIENIL